MTFDSEDLLDEILAVMTSGLSAKIAAIEAEKVAAGKGITGGLAAIAAGSYYRQAWDDKILNSAPAIYYGIEDVQTTDGGPVASETYKIFCEVVLVDSGMDAFATRRIARYSRALKELFQENFKKVSWASRIKIETVRPISFRLEVDSSEEIKVGGVSLAVSLV